MSYEFPPDLRKLVDEHMSTGLYASEDELLGSALTSMVIDDDEVVAIRAGLESYRNGAPGVPLEEAFAKLRAKHGIPS